MFLRGRKLISQTLTSNITQFDLFNCPNIDSVTIQWDEVESHQKYLIKKGDSTSFQPLPSKILIISFTRSSIWRKIRSQWNSKSKLDRHLVITSLNKKFWKFCTPLAISMNRNLSIQRHYFKLEQNAQVRSNWQFILAKKMIWISIDIQSVMQNPEEALEVMALAAMVFTSIWPDLLLNNNNLYYDNNHTE